jgi:thiamine-monophosphate kinase
MPIHPTGPLVREIGEFALIERLANCLPPAARATPGSGIGIGDDAALWLPEPGNTVVITTDALVEHVHFRLDWTGWTDLGHKMLAVNLSDIAAMGAVPKVATIVLGLTGNEHVADLEAMYVGLGTLAAAHGVTIVGGDIVRVPHDVTLGVTLLGEVEASRALRRDGARPGDLIVVSGTIGASAAGLALLDRGIDETATSPLLIAAHFRPNPRIALGKILHDAGVTSAMDLSDGLLGDLPKILEASGVAGEIDVGSLPILPAVRALFPGEFERLALRGGEDYELLMTIPESRFDALRERSGAVGATVTAVGRILPEKGNAQVQVMKDGAPHTIAEGAFDHFG